MKRHTFTLVELLVVVGIIALLAGLIIPAVGMAQTSARRTACLSNQGQVMKIMRTFMNEGDRQILPNSLTDHGTWTRQLFEKNKLHNDLTVARCPSILVSSAAAPGNKKEISPDDTDAQKDAKCLEAYGMIFSPDGVPGVDFKSTKALKCTPDSGKAYTVAANQMAVGACSARLVNDQLVGRALIDFGAKGESSTNTIGRPALVHDGQTNVFFLDGHAESFTRTGLYQTRYYVAYSGSTSDHREAIKVANYKDGSSTKARPNPSSDDQYATKDWLLDPDKAEE